MLINHEEMYLDLYKKVYNLKMKIGPHYFGTYQIAYWDALYEVETIEKALKEYDDRIHPGRGTWIPMHSGHRFWIDDPRPEDIYLEDIVYGLSRLPRFLGRTKYPYYVAEHSVFVSRLLPKRLKLRGLFHDAPEAYIGDVVSPVKWRIADVFNPIEHKIMDAIAKKFNFDMDPADDVEVKKVDLIALATEVRDLTNEGYVGRFLEYPPSKSKIISASLDYKDVEKMFMDTYLECK